MNVNLIGYRGSGKTTVARCLAELLQWQWLDTDAEVERRAGKSIADIFGQHGEQAFRDLESHEIEAVGRRTRTVVALGGGAVLRAANRRILAESGRTVWLTASPETLLARLEHDPATAGRRPHLTPAGGLREIREVLAAREPLYQASADLVVDTHQKRPQAVAEEIVQRLQLTSKSTDPE